MTIQVVIPEKLQFSQYLDSSFVLHKYLPIQRKKQVTELPPDY